MASSPQRGGPSGGGGGGGRRPILYQIDFTAVASGKRIAATKRRVRWRFGFANTEAIDAGQTGTACRGEEHDVTLVWSLTSGKRMILADGQEIHYSNNRGNVFEWSWTMRGNNVLKIVAHASPPMSPTPGFRQYDFFVNGLTFFTFPKVFRLGLPNDPRGNGGEHPSSPASLAESSRRYGGGDGGRGPSGSGGPRRTSAGSERGSSVNIANLEAPGNQDEEEAYLQEAIRQSLKPEPKPEPSAPPEPPSDLLDFSEPAPPAHPAPQTIQATTSDFFSVGETVQSDPYMASQAVGHHQSFASLPALTTGPSNHLPSANGMAYPPGYAAPAAPGALVISTTQSSPYNGYGVPAASNPYAAPTNHYTGASGANPYGSAPAANPYAVSASVANPYDVAAPAANPYGVPSAPAATNPYGAPVSNPYEQPPATSSAANPYGVPVPAPIATNSFGAPPPQPAAPTAVIPYGGSAPTVNPVGAGSLETSLYQVQTPTANAYGPTATTAANPYGASAAANSYGAANPYGESAAASAAADTKLAWTPPDRITTQPNPYDSTLPNSYNTFSGSVPSAITPHATTPSSLGFGSPAPDFSGFSPEPDVEVKSSKSQPSSFIDQTFAKLASFDNFSVESKKDSVRANPFEFSGGSTIGGNKSLADIAKIKPKAAKEVMKTSVPVQATMTSTSQSGYGMQQYQGYPSAQTQQQPATYGQQQPAMHSQSIPQPPSAQTHHQPATYGQQQPAMHSQSIPQQQSMGFRQAPQTYGQPMTQQQQQPMTQQHQQQPTPQLPYGQAPAPPMYGQPPPPQQQGYY